MAAHYNNGSAPRKRRDWRRTIVFILCGLLMAILFWIGVLWAALKAG